MSEAAALQQPESLREIFDRYAKDIAKDFPQMAGRLAILDVKAGQWSGDIDLEKISFASDAEFKTFADGSQEINKQDTTAVWHCINPDLYILSFVEAMRFTRSLDQDRLFTLDHEIGHLVVQDAYTTAETASNHNFRECAADIFASLKHMQRFGIDPEFIDDLASKRASYFALAEEPTHFTTFALEALKPLLNKIDFSTLTPEKMTALSWRMAAEFSLHQKLIDNLSATFKNALSKLPEDSPFEDKLKAIADLICDDKTDYYPFRTGLVLLKPYLENQMRYTNGANIYLIGPYWDGVRQKLKEKEFQLAADELLFNIPVLKKEPAPQTSPPSP